MGAVVDLFSRSLARFVARGFRQGEGEQYAGPQSYGKSGLANDMSDERALQIAAVWACHSLLVDALSMMPMILYQRNADGSRSEVKTHPLTRVMLRAPNAAMSAMDYRTAMNFHIIGFGGGHSRIERNGVGEVIDLFPMMSAQTKQIVRSGGEIIYQYETQRGIVDLASDEVFHVRGFGFNGLTGLGTIPFARRLLGVAAATQDHAEQFYTNGARPSGTFTIDKILTKDQRQAIRENFLTKIEGMENAFRVLLLEAGMKYEKMGYSPEEMQMRDQQQWNSEQICMMWRVPPFPHRSPRGPASNRSTWASSPTPSCRSCGGGKVRAMLNCSLRKSRPRCISNTIIRYCSPQT
jgi:HK97 family phage portal protein